MPVVVGHPPETGDDYVDVRFIPHCGSGITEQAYLNGGDGAERQVVEISRRDAQGPARARGAALPGSGRLRVGRAGGRRGGPGSAFDLDLPGLGLWRLWQANGQDAVSQLGVGLPGVRVGGQSSTVGELALPPPQRLALALFLFRDLTGDAQLVAA